MKPDIVTGATGQVGLELCRALVAAGRTVRAVVVPGDRITPTLTQLGIETVEADVRDVPALRDAIDGAAHLYHLAAIVSTTPRHDPRMWQVNVEGARNVATLARTQGAQRLIYFSSIVVFEPDPTDQPLDERRPRVPVAGAAPYVQSKIVGEQVVREQIELGLDAVIVHPTVVIGANEVHHAGVVRNLLFRYFDRALPAVFRGGFDAVAAADVVQGAIAAATAGHAGHSYILSGQFHSIRDLLRRTRPWCGAPIPRVAIPITLARSGLPLVEIAARLTGRPPAFTPEDLRQMVGNRQISHAKAEHELGYRPNGLDTALRDVYEAWQRRT
ncbi:MAG: NAD-dependent epimerase/dehydratase family protein [Deltaproteobacteria bacterium]|nr:NAD-dependent epimerase/dehydratase family protein [Deltaproteobacteria bacterium]